IWLLSWPPSQHTGSRDHGTASGARLVRRPPGSRSIDELLADARSRLVRLSPAEAMEALASGAILVDIRPEAQRREEGEIPGALIVERNVLEWRFDPTSAAPAPLATY